MGRACSGAHVNGGGGGVVYSRRTEELEPIQRDRIQEKGLVN